MKIRHLFCSLVIMLAPAVFAQGEKDAQPPQDFKWWVNLAPDHPWSLASVEVIEEIKQKTEGRVAFKIYYSQSLGNQMEGVNLLRNKSVFAFLNGPALLADYDERTEVFSMPYVIDNPQKLFRIWDKHGEDIFAPSLKKSGVRVVGFWDLGYRSLTTKGIPVRKPEDLAGVKIRAIDYPMAINMVRSLGANPVPVPFSELYIALQTGVAQGQENPIPTIFSNKYYEVQDHLILTRHLLNVGTLLVSEALWQAVPEQDRQVISEVFNGKRERVSQMIVDESSKYLEQMKAKGLTVIEPDREAFKQASLKLMMSKYGDKYGDFISLLQNS